MFFWLIISQRLDQRISSALLKDLLQALACALSLHLLHLNSKTPFYDLFGLVSGAGRWRRSHGRWRCHAYGPKGSPLKRFMCSFDDCRCLFDLKAAGERPFYSRLTHDVSSLAVALASEAQRAPSARKEELQEPQMQARGAADAGDREAFGLNRPVSGRLGRL